jgi:hypothetical protein
VTRRGTFEAVVSEVSRGTTPGEAARRLGLSAGLADIVVDEAERLGLLSRFGGTCSVCEGRSVQGCIGCPLPRIRCEA